MAARRRGYTFPLLPALSLISVSHRPKSSARDLTEIGQEIVRFSGKRLTHMRFIRNLEQRFQQEIAPKRRKQLSIQGLSALLIYDLFIISDYMASPQQLFRAFIVRFCIITPLVLLTTLIASRQAAMKYRDLAASMLCYAGCVSVLYLHAHSGLASGVQTESGFFLVLLAMNAVLRLELVYSLVTSALCYATAMCFLLNNPLFSPSLKFTVGAGVFWSSVFSCYANYALTRERRLAWLQQARSRIQGRLLAETNRELISLSTTDRLTGLANRHAYEDRIADLWHEAASDDSPLSAIMVDVDHFKRINDTFGHPYGDRVLQRIATLLQQALREEDDFVARYGGEEFIVLLPDADEIAARRVAERIRTLVEVAGSPSVTRHDASPISNPNWATVSCGVATVVPTHNMERRILIEVADAALYRAKKGGRNQVCCAPVHPASTGRFHGITRVS